MTEDFERWLTKEEASEALGERGIDIKPTTLYERARTGKLPSGKPAGKRRFRLSQLLAHFEEQTKTNCHG